MYKITAYFWKGHGKRAVTLLFLGGLLVFGAYYFSAGFFSGARAATNTLHINQCGTLSQANTKYILDNDVSSEGTCFTITADDVELDLNGKTVTYDTFGGVGFSDAGFESGSGESLDSSWTIEQPNNQTIKREANSVTPMVGSWHMFWGNAENGSRIISPWSSLPINTGVANNATAYILRGDPTWGYAKAPLFNMTVEYKDDAGNIQTVSSIDFTSQQQFDFPTKQTSGQYRAILTLKDGYGLSLGQYGKLPTFDEFNLAPLAKYGVSVSYRKNIVVKNGRIIQGPAHSFKGHGVSLYSGTNETVSGLYVENNGWEAAGINANYVSNLTIDNNEVHNFNPYVHNRMQLSAAVNAFGASDYVITNNTIYSGAGWGAMYISGTNNADIAFNKLYTQSTITNHFALGGGVTSNMKIHDNIIDANPGQGISTGGNGNEIYNNTITLRMQEPNMEYGFIEFDAFKMNDYGNEPTNKNIYVHDNTINLFGKINRYYAPDPGPGPLPENINGNTVYKAVMNGISNIATGGNIRYSHNTITARSIDKDVKVNGISPGVIVSDKEVIFDHNIVDSDVANIELGGYAGQGDIPGNVKFYSNTLIKGSTANEYYHTIGMGRSGNIKKDLMRFIDTDLQDGASITDVDLKTDYGRFSYFVDWYLDILVQDAGATPVAGANIIVKDKNSNVVFNGTTGIDGRIKRIVIDQLQHVGSGILNQSVITQSSPHTVTVTYPDSSQKIETLTMDKSKDLIFQKDGTTQITNAIQQTLTSDTIPPVLNDIVPKPGVVDWDQTNFTISFKTSEAATCRYSTNSGVSFDNMTNDFSTADGVTQSKNVTLSNGTTQSFYVLCRDSAGNTLLDPQIITYSADAAPTSLAIPATADVAPPTQPLLYAKMESDSEIAAPTISSGLLASGSVTKSGTGAQLLYESGLAANGSLNSVDGNAAHFVNTSSNPSELANFAPGNFDFSDTDDNGGTLEFWLKFNVNPHIYTGNKFILSSDPWPRPLSIELYGSNPYMAFEFHDPLGQIAATGGRFMVYTANWNKWLDWKKGEWHKVTLTWKRNVGANAAEMHLYIDGTQEGCPTSVCNDYFGKLPDSLDKVSMGNLGGSYAYDFSLDEIKSYNQAIEFSDNSAPVTMVNPTGGTFFTTQSVTMIANKGTIYYTLDGSTPTENSARYTGPLQLSQNTTLKYFAKDSAGNAENVKTQVYNIDTTKHYSLSDVINLIANWLGSANVADINADGTVNSRDLGVMMSKWQ